MFVDHRKIRALDRMQWVLVLVALVAFSLTLAQAEPSITTSPRKVGPGDIMTVTVKDAQGPMTGTFDGKPLFFNEIAGMQEAVVGIDLGMEPGTYALKVSVDGKEQAREVKVSKKKYPVQRLTLPEDLVTLSPENEARVSREARLLSALWPVDSERFWTGSFIDPLPGKELGTPFGVRRIINKVPKSSHSGVDLTADEGEPVLAPNDGVVVLIDDQFFSGNSVILDHGQGIYTMFFHLSKVEVKYGQAVMKGDVIARVGSTGRSTGPHLHWGVRMQGAKVDPLQLIKLKLD
jgi:murein DD-endopeptidase MepM/ murein hydrolase activator NlpD